MTWLNQYRFRKFLRTSLWLLPSIGMILAILMAAAAYWLDAQTHWVLIGYGLDGAKAVVGTLVASLLSLIVFTFSILMLAVQVAGGQLSPRIIAGVFERPLTRLTLAVFIFCFFYSLAVLGRIEGRVPQLPVFLAVATNMVCIAMFIALIQVASKGLRPIAVLTRQANRTCAVIETMYPRPFVRGAETGERAGPVDSQINRVIRQEGHSGVLQAFDAAGLADLAARGECAIELVPQVGDFVFAGSEIFRIRGAVDVDDQDMRCCIALGVERVLDYDPAFGFRIIVDIGIKALSPAINDPTTGVLAIDQLEQLLCLLGQRELDSGVVRDSTGVVRLVYRTPGWDAFVALAATEMRLCGGNSPQVTRRLRAMFDRLDQSVPAERRGPIRAEIALLQGAIDRNFADPADRCRATVPDCQGFGSEVQLPRG